MKNITLEKLQLNTTYYGTFNDMIFSLKIDTKNSVKAQGYYKLVDFQKPRQGVKIDVHELLNCIDELINRNIPVNFLDWCIK